MCIDRLEQGMLPMCVTTCPMRALDFRPWDELQAEYGTIRELKDMPNSMTTKPAVIFKPMAAKKTLVTYPIEKALTLMVKQDQLAPDTVEPDKLLLKPKDAKELRRQILDLDG